MAWYSMRSARTSSSITRWLYWQRRSLMSVLRRARADRRLRAAQRLPEHARRARRRPRERVAGRDDARVAPGGLEPEGVLFLHERDLVAGLGQEVRGRDADDPAAEDERLHRGRLTRRGGIRPARDRPDRTGTG